MLAGAGNLTLNVHYVDTISKKKEDLETHLRTCEMYECGRYSCWLRVKSLSDMKKHIEEKHTTSTSLHHLKIDREKEFSVTSKFYYVKDL